MSSQWLSMTRRALVGSPLRTAARIARCWRAEWSMFFVQHRDGVEHVVQVGLHHGHRPDRERRVGDRRDRQVEARVGLPVLGGVRRRRHVVVRRDQELLPVRGQVALGRDVAGAGLDHPPEDQHVAQRLAARPQRPGPPGGRLARPVAHHGAATTAPGGVHELGGAQRRDRLPQRRARDAQPLGQLALGREARAPRVDPEPDGGGELLDAALEGVVPPHRAQDGLAQLDAGVGRHAASLVTSRQRSQWFDFKPFTPGLWTCFRGRRYVEPTSPLDMGALMSESTELSKDEQLLAKLGYKQELSRSWSGFSNFAISFSIISILAGCFTTFYQGWNNGGPVAISWGWPLISAFILIIGFTMSELVSAYPTSGGIYWWASKMGGPAAGFFTGWLNLIGLLAVTASVAYGAATFLDLTISTISSSWADGYSPHPGVHPVRGDPGARRGDEHLPQPPARGRQQHLGVVARRRRGDRDPGPDHRAGHPPERELRVHRADQQLRLQQQQLLVPRAAAGLPAHAVHDHRLRRLGPPVGGDPRRGGRCGQGHLAVDLLLGHRRLRAAAGVRLRGAGPRQGDRGGRRHRRDLRAGAAGGLALPGAADLHRRPAVLHHRVPDQRVPDDLRVQPRRRDPRLDLAGEGQPARRGSRPTRSCSSPRSASSSRCPR